MRLILPDYCKQSKSNECLVWIFFGFFTNSCNGEWEVARKAMSNGDKIQCVSVDGLPPTIDKSFLCNSNINITACDVKDPESVRVSVANCVKHFKGIDILLNWVDGGFDRSEFEKWLCGSVPLSVLIQDEEETRRLMEFNLFGLFNILQAVLPVLKSSIPAATANVTDELKKRILSISNTLAVMGGPGMGPYSASRKASEGLLHTLSTELFGESSSQILITVVDLGTSPVDSNRVKKLSTLIWELVHCGNPPCRISFGKQPSEVTNNQLRRTLEEMEDWKYLFEDK